MAENLGAIRYDVEVETASLLKAESLIDKSLDGVVKDFDKADKAVREFENTQKSLGRTINGMGQVLNKNGKVVASASIEYRKLASQAGDSFNTLNTRVNGVAHAVNRSFTPALTNASYQIQDIAVQLAGGQNPFLVMAQQIPQLLTGMGALAAGIGGVVAVLGGLYLAFGDSATNAEKLEKAVEQVKAVMTIGADGVANYSDELEKLSAVSEIIAEAKIAAAIKTQEDAIKNAFNAARDTLDDFGTIFSNTNQTIAKETGFSVAAISELDQALRLRNADQAEQAVGMLSAELSNATSDGREFFGQIIDIVGALVTAKSDLDSMNESVNNTGVTLEDTADKMKNLVESLLLQRAELQGGERAAFAMKLALDGLSEAEQNAVLAIYDTNKAIEAQTEAAKESNKALEDEIDNWIKIGEEATRAEEKKAAAAQREQERLAQRGTTVGLTEVQTVESRYESDLEALKAAKEQELITKEEYAQREIELERQKAEQINNINQQQMQDQKLFTKSQGQLLSSFGDLFGAYANNMEVQNKKDFERKKKFQTAQALINTAMAVSNALAAAPPPINFALAGVAGAMGAMQVAAIQNQQYSGGRQYGGPVSQGMYRVNETGVPEVYSYGGKDYLMNTKNANIKPMEQAGGSMPQIIVNNNSPERAYVTYDEAANIANVQIGKEVGKMAKGQGRMFKAVKQGTQTRGNARN
jgi:hypothetical protein